MGPKNFATVLALSSAAFVGGLVIGERTWSADRFAKYERNASYSEMDRALLQANLELTRGFVEAAPGVDVPNVYFDAQQRKIVAVSIVNAEYLKTLSSDALKGELLKVVMQTWVETSQTFDELKDISDKDFIVEFKAMRKDSKAIFMFADWKNGELSVH